MPQIRVNFTAKVNSEQIRRESHNGRDLLIVPSRTLPAGVIMNGGLYTAEEIDKHYKKLEGTLAPLGHPQINGQYISAFSPEGINLAHVGAFNRNVKKVGNRVHIEKWIDLEVAGRTENGKRLIERIEALERGEDVPPIHTSVAAFIDQIEASEEERKNGYDWIAKIYDFDHDAILLDEVGAATPEQGVGMMVNCDSAKLLQVNEGALIGESYREKERRLDKAVKEKFVFSNDDYAYVIDFTDSQMIVARNGGKTEIFGYKNEAGKIIIDDNGLEVERRESWFNVVANTFEKIASFLNPLASPATNKEVEAMPITDAEKSQIVKEVSEAVSASVGEVVANAIKPLSETVSQLQANHEKIVADLKSNADKQTGEMRKAVAAKFGEVVANALNGEALAEAYKQVGEAAAISGGAISGNSQKFEPPSVDSYFGNSAK